MIDAYLTHPHLPGVSMLSLGCGARKKGWTVAVGLTTLPGGQPRPPGYANTGPGGMPGVSLEFYFRGRIGDEWMVVSVLDWWSGSYVRVWLVCQSVVCCVL